MIAGTLKGVEVKRLTDNFNLAFGNYYVPMHLTEEQFLLKINADNTRLDLSAGIYEQDQLVAFLLHGVDQVDNKKIAYNAGTGVIPSHRGNKLTQKMYEFIIPLLQQEEVDTIQLEVIEENKAAISQYNLIGFTCSRSLACYKGMVKELPFNEKVKIKILPNLDWKILKSYWDFIPSWQNSARVANLFQSTFISLGAYQDEVLVGYLIYNPGTKRVQQFAVDRSSRGNLIASTLFTYIRNNYGPELFVINADASSTETNSFLQRLGLSKFITQMEMTMTI